MDKLLNSKIQIETPCFVLDKQHLDRNLEAIQSPLQRLWEEPILGYSFKTNSLPWVVSYFQAKELYAEVVSATEYDLALQIGYPPERIIYNGPIKNMDSFYYALEHGSLINVDSKAELEYLENIDSDLKFQYEIGLRVNVDLEVLTPGQTIMGEEGGRFGFSLETGELDEAIQRVEQLQNVSLACLHLHSNSKTRSLEVFSAITQFGCEIIKKFKLHIQYLDIGGGFFGGPQATISFDLYLKTIKEILIANQLGDIQLIVEPGASIIASPIDYVCTVMDVKETSRGCFVVLDGSRTNIDPMKRKSSYKIQLPDTARKPKAKQTLVGSTCMEDDRFMVLDNHIELQVGDTVIFEQVGSYTMSLSPLFINYLPTVYVKDNETYQVVRRAWGNDEFLRSNLFYNDQRKVYL